MASRGSTGNVIAALCSFFIPGLGQLIQGRPVIALLHFVVSIVTLGIRPGMADAYLVRAVGGLVRTVTWDRPHPARPADARSARPCLRIFPA